MLYDSFEEIFAEDNILIKTKGANDRSFDIHK
jgi:hypothetical protein